MDPYRLDEVDDVWRRLAEEAWVDVASANMPYRLAALRVIAERARVTEGELRAYMAAHERSVDVEVLQQVARRVVNIRRAACAGHEALALRGRPLPERRSRPPTTSSPADDSGEGGPGKLQGRG